MGDADESRGRGMNPRWALPEYIDDVLPAEAARVERLRRRLLDLFAVHGYDYVIPPLIEYLESLLTGTGRDLDLRTFKLVDQLSGRMLGVRADITPQAARIDAHMLDRKGVARLCYAGQVLHTLPMTENRSRESIQVGAELFGHAGVESDIEVQRLMLEALKAAGIERASIDLGHVGILRALVASSGVSGEREQGLFEALQHKDLPALRSALGDVAPKLRDAFLLLPQLYGDERVLREAARRLPKLPQIGAALKTLRRLAQATSDLVHGIRFDLGELRGYRYHSGVVFAAYAPGWTGALARGGRYDEVGVAFGRSRPATGFSMDLRDLAGALRDCKPRRVLAPSVDAPALARLVKRLRARGDVVVNDLPGHAGYRSELDCSHAIVRDGERWVLRSLG